MNNSIFFLLLLLVWNACSLNLDINQQDTITQEDVEAVSQIIGESLSDENSGIIGSFYDAITNISSSGFVRSTDIQAKAVGHDANTGRGNESEINYRYNAETGEHELSFQRLVNTTDYIKHVRDTLKYIYTSRSGSFIADLNSVAGNTRSITFTAEREGEIETPSRTSFFTRNDTFLINGVEGSSTELTIDGVHIGHGFFNSVTSTDSVSFERSYELEVNFLNIRITKSVLEQNISLEQGVSGALTYSLFIEDPNNRSVSRIIKGSLDMVGDGNATLRFNGAPGLFQINLDNGDVNDQQREFEGRIVSVNVEASTFTLVSGITVLVDEQTSVSAESDLFTLEAIQSALQRTPFIRAEGEGVISGNIFRASKVEFEIDEDNDDENDELEFEQEVVSVDLGRKTFSLKNGTIIGVDENTVFKNDGNYGSLEQVADALAENIPVQADGEARYIDTDSLHYIAIEVEFEEAESGGGTDIDKINFEDRVTSIDLSLNRITLINGAVIAITSETIFKGDVNSLEQARDALSSGKEVEADGKGIEDKENEQVDLIALEIEFEIEE